MIKRKYFVRAKVQHNDNTGLYSWWSGVMIIRSILPPSGEDIFNSAMIIARQNISSVFDVQYSNQVEIESLNKI